METRLLLYLATNNQAFMSYIYLVAGYTQLAVTGETCPCFRGVRKFEGLNSRTDPVESNNRQGCHEVECFLVLSINVISAVHIKCTDSQAKNKCGTRSIRRQVRAIRIILMNLSNCCRCIIYLRNSIPSQSPVLQ